MQIVLNASFLNSESGRLFTTYHSPVERPQKAVLFCPPFAEEMNKCRRMMTLQARRCAAAGWGSLIIDLFGTGDSEGDFEDSSWEAWEADLDCAVRWLESQGIANVVCLGVRVGGLLALRAAGRQRVASRVVLWQPQLDGANALRQFLRMRVVAEKMAGASTTVGQLVEELESGKSVEVAGYRVSPRLFLGMQGIAVSQRCHRDVPVDWIDVVADQHQKSSPVSERTVSGWRDQGAIASLSQVAGDPFWNTVETTVVPGLLDTTLELLHVQ